LDEDSGPSHRDSKRDRIFKWSVLKTALFEWEQRYEHANNTVTGEVLRVKATELWTWLSCYEGQSTPKWTDGWLAGFKFRHGLKLRIRHDEVDDADLSVDTLVTMNQIREKGQKYDAEDVFNMDETGYF